MIGFEVKINDQLIEVALEDGVASVILNRIKIKKQDRDEICLDISGLNTETEDRYKWAAQDLKVGDTINILVKDVSQHSLPEIKKSDSEETKNANKVKYFHTLQKELTEKGLI